MYWKLSPLKESDGLEVTKAVSLKPGRKDTTQEGSSFNQAPNMAVLWTQLWADASSRWQCLTEQGPGEAVH